MEVPGKGKRLLPRELVRVVTPGTVVEEALLPQRESIYPVTPALNAPAAGQVAREGLLMPPPSPSDARPRPLRRAAASRRPRTPSLR
ncbi:hypothetical protein HRbin24_00129 [bacterium HR24]|nr:hypothetical protein HRbin24_00129 [bacterium HR24]